MQHEQFLNLLWQREFWAHSGEWHNLRTHYGAAQESGCIKVHHYEPTYRVQISSFARFGGWHAPLRFEMCTSYQRQQRMEWLRFQAAYDQRLGEHRRLTSVHSRLLTRRTRGSKTAGTV